MLELQLKKLRKLAGYRTQSDMAKALGIPSRRYESWEREEAMMSLEQACMVADVLECTLDELAGREVSGELSNPYERELLGCYRESTEQRKASILQTARDAAGMSKDAAERGVPDAEVGRAV